MSPGYRVRVPALLLTGLVCVPHLLAAQNPSNAPAVTMNASKAEALTVTINSGGTVNFDLNSGTVAGGDVSVSVTLDWTVQGNRTNVELWGAFASSSEALADGNGYFIPSSAVEGRVTTGSPTTFTPFTATASNGFLGAAGAALLLVSEDPSGANRSGTRTDALELQIDQTGLSLPAGTFTGTLTLQATAF